MIPKTITLLAAATFILATATDNARAGTLENLERERAIIVATMLAPDLAVADRQEKIAQSRHRLVDLERMVLRDKTIVGKNTPIVRKAFDNYDLTFLVHSSVEKSKALVDHWLGEMGITTHALMNARMGKR